MTGWLPWMLACSGPNGPSPGPGSSGGDSDSQATDSEHAWPLSENPGVAEDDFGHPRSTLAGCRTTTFEGEEPTDRLTYNDSGYPAYAEYWKQGDWHPDYTVTFELDSQGRPVLEHYEFAGLTQSFASTYEGDSWRQATVVEETVSYETTLNTWTWTWTDTSYEWVDEEGLTIKAQLGEGLREKRLEVFNTSGRLTLREYDWDGGRLALQDINEGYMVIEYAYDEEGYLASYTSNGTVYAMEWDCGA